MKLTRVYKMKLESNFTKADTARYSYQRHLTYVNVYNGKWFFSQDGKASSTRGMGQLVNKAQHCARGLIRALKASGKATGNKMNVPEVTKIGCPGTIKADQHTSYDYWLTIENQFARTGGVALPCKAHKALNAKLRTGWKLLPTAELFISRRGVHYALVFVQKEVEKAKPSEKGFLGIDVGYRNGVIRSDGYVGRNTSKIIRKERLARSERQRQSHRKKSVKTKLKQVLDCEAKRSLRRSQALGLSLAVESPKVLNNLRSGKLHGWARTYFANRAQVLGQEMGVFVWEVNPAYTSQTCHACGNIDKRNRKGIVFKCVACNHVAHADINAARNVSVKGTASLRRNYAPKRSGVVS